MNFQLIVVIILTTVMFGLVWQWYADKHKPKYPMFKLNWEHTDTITIPENIDIIIPEGVSIDIPSGKTLTINGTMTQEESK